MRRCLSLCSLALLAAACGGDPDAEGDGASTAADADGDGVKEFEDCDDADATVYPGAPEVCDGVDNNCDGTVDEADPAVDLSTGGTWQLDADGDGFGSPDETVQACDQPDGTTDDTTDCDDSSPRVYPGADETCGDAIDQDCDGVDLRCAPQGVLSPSAADAVLRGGDGTSFGASLLGGHDLNLDGAPDVLVGAPQAANGGAANAGAVAIFAGSVEGGADAPSGADAWIAGASSDDRFGFALAAADGVLAASATDGGALGGGAVSIYGDWGESLPGALSSWTTLTADAGAVAGYALAVHDLAGDGAADVLIGAIGEATGGFAAGALWVVPDAASLDSADLDAVGVALHGAERDNAGWAVVAGDLDGDGQGDLVIGVPGRRDRGGAFVVSGPVTATADLDAVGDFVAGGPAGFRMGETLAGGQDLDGDGYGDVLFADRADLGDRGSAWLIPGPITAGTDLESAAVATFTGGVEDFLGYEAAFVGDLDGDGLDELALSGDKNDETWLFYGPLEGAYGPAESDGRVRGSDGAELGAALSGAGDQDADGYDELMVADPDADLVLLYFGGRR